MTLQGLFLLIFLLTPSVLSLESSSDPGTNTLLLGGITDTEYWATSMELITDTGVCTPKLPPIPVGRHSAAAVLINSKILYCGGRDIDGTYHQSCHSYKLGEGDTNWEEEPGMVRGRIEFSMSVVGDLVYAVGTGGIHGNTVEYFNYESTSSSWREDSYMGMDRHRYGHCSIVWGQDIVILGGITLDGPSNSVQAIDTSNKPKGWRYMASMETPRYGHGCHVWTYEGHTGILVAGGDDGRSVLSSVEMFLPTTNSYLALPSLVSPRLYYSLSVIGANLVVAGGWNQNGEILSSIEYCNITDSEWNVGNNITVVRSNHSGVSVPVELLDC